MYRVCERERTKNKFGIKALLSDTRMMDDRTRSRSRSTLRRPLATPIEEEAATYEEEARRKARTESHRYE